MRCRLGLAIVLAVGGCTAVDRYDRFQFPDGGSAADLASTGGGDLSMTGATFGSMCTLASDCTQYGAMRPVECITTFSGQVFPAGICTRSCALASSGACSDFNGLGPMGLGSVCVPINNNGLCLARCQKGGNPCRTGYACCNRGLSGSDGVCAPIGSDTCL